MQSEPLLENRQQQVDTDGDPDLNFDGIGRGAVEGLDAEMLLDPFEEQLHLPACLVEREQVGRQQRHFPAAFVKLRDGQRREGEVVGQEDQVRVMFRVEEMNAASRRGPGRRRKQRPGPGRRAA